MKLNCLCIFAHFLCVLSYGQEARRSTLASLGKSSQVQTEQKSLYIQSSIGQASVIGKQNAESYQLRQGFIQPFSAKFIKSSSSSDLEATVYPNPFRESFFIQLPEELDFEIKLVDITGRLVYQNKFFNTSTIRISPYEYPAGTYIIYIQAGRRVYVGQIIKY